MSLITNIVEAQIRDASDTVEGDILTRPALLATDGLNVTYACDVDIGQEGTNANGDIINVYLENVPIAALNRQLLYVEIGQAVLLRKNSTGRWEISALSKTKPGTLTIVPVTMPDYCFGIPTPEIGTAFTVGIEVEAIPYGEISDLGNYGDVPYGAVAVYENGELIEVRAR